MHQFKNNNQIRLSSLSSKYVKILETKFCIFEPSERSNWRYGKESYTNEGERHKLAKLEYLNYHL